MNKLIIIPLLFVLIALVPTINRPFVGVHDFNGVQEGTVARNYLEHGALNLKFGQKLGLIRGSTENLTGFYTSYLPTLPLLVAGSFAVFGVSEWAARLIPLFFSMAGTIALFFLARKLWNVTTAILASLFFVFNPMFIYYGNMPVPDGPILAMMVVSFYFYIRWLEDKKQKDFILLLVSLFIGGMIGWIINYLGPLFILHSLLLSKFNLRILIPSVVLTIPLFLQFFHAYVLTGDWFGGNMISSLKNRISGAPTGFGGVEFNMFNYIKKEMSWFQSYFTRILLVLNIINLKSFIPLKFTIQNVTLITLLILGLAHPILFSSAVFIHDYQNIYLLPFLAIGGALGLIFFADQIHKFHKKSSWRVVIIGLVCLFFLLERKEFTLALLRYDMNKEGKEMANIVNELQQQPNQAIIVSPRFGSFYQLFTDFYSKYPYQLIDEASLKQELDSNINSYTYIIMIDQDIQDGEFYNSLINKYRSEKRGDKTIIYLNEQKAK